MGVDVVGKRTGGSGPEVREELVLGIKRDNMKGELLKGRSGQGGQ